MKSSSEPYEGKLHVRFFVEGNGNRVYKKLLRHYSTRSINRKDDHGFRSIPVTGELDDIFVFTTFVITTYVVVSTVKEIIVDNVKKDVESVVSGKKTKKEESSETKSKSKPTINKDAGALDSLGRQLEFDFRKKGKRITEEEANIIDDWCKEYDVPQHHGVEKGRDNHWDYGNHTHIRSRHIPFK